MPLGLSFMLPMLAAIAAGASWGALAGFLKAKAGTNEVISTLLLSFIAIWLLYWSVQSERLLRRPMTDSATLPESLEIPALTKTLFGTQLRMVGFNPLAARRAGIPIDRTIVLALALAGAFGGLAGALMLQGDQQLLKVGFSSGYGFDGLVVGLLARGSVLGVIGGALLFGFLRSGGINMEMVAAVPSALVMIIQGTIIVTIAGAAFWLDRKEASR